MRTTDRDARSALSFWNGLIPKIDALLETQTRIIYPGSKDPYYQWFMELESGAFRAELRYSSEELEERLANEDLLFFFIASSGGREAVVLAYEDPDNPNSALYLDTIAVKSTGRGLGSLLMRALIDYAKAKSYLLIRLDTEQVNEKGQQLVRFYQSLGFHETDSTEDGNISMELRI
ncbi:MAG: GNAT family N-acetyltransferase [Candidatus Thorarchaeota archaeon]